MSHLWVISLGVGVARTSVFLCRLHCFLLAFVPSPCRLVSLSISRVAWLPILTANRSPHVLYAAGYMKADAATQATLKTKEIKNARLAMLAFAGFVAQVRTGCCMLVLSV